MASPGKKLAMRKQNARRRLTGEAFSLGSKYRRFDEQNFQQYCTGSRGSHLSDGPSRLMRRDLKLVGVK